MKKTHLITIVALLLLLGIGINFNGATAKKAPVKTNIVTTPPPPVPHPDPSIAAFQEMMKVVAHKRCVNCHPAGDRPHQGEDSHVHNFGVQRGEDGHGTVALKCSTCHQKENNDFSGVPGAPHWHLAPRSMGWEGLSHREIALAMTDTEKNGGRSIEEIAKHLTEDPLVLWAFEPGLNHEGVPREKPPISKEAYIEAVKKWVETGAKIPEE